MEKYIELVRDKFMEELWNERRFDAADPLFTEDFITESIGNEPGDWSAVHGKGPGSMIHHIKWWLSIIPDARIHLLNIAASGNEVITNWELSGAMTGAMFGVSPTNKKLSIFGATVSIFQKERIKLNKTLLDRLGLFQQINALPPIAQFLKK